MNELRTRTVLLKVNEWELHQLDELAGRANMKRSPFLRELLLFLPYNKRPEDWPAFEKLFEESEKDETT